MTIAYDVSVMQDLVSACSSANSELEKAQRLILEVRSHNDWTCKEKDAIDDLMNQCRNMVKRLSEQQQAFLEAVRQVAGDLGDAEQSVSGLFSGVEDILQRILAIPVPEHITVGSSLLGANAASSVLQRVSEIFPSDVVSMNDGFDLSEWMSGAETVSVWEAVRNSWGTAVNSLGQTTGSTSKDLLSEIMVSSFQDLDL